MKRTKRIMCILLIVLLISTVMFSNNAFAFCRTDYLKGTGVEAKKVISGIRLTLPDGRQLIDANNVDSYKASTSSKNLNLIILIDTSGDEKDKALGHFGNLIDKLYDEMEIAKLKVAVMGYDDSSWNNGIEFNIRDNKEEANDDLVNIATDGSLAKGRKLEEALEKAYVCFEEMSQEDGYDGANRELIIYIDKSTNDEIRVNQVNEILKNMSEVPMEVSIHTLVYYDNSELPDVDIRNVLTNKAPWPSEGDFNNPGTNPNSRIGKRWYGKRKIDYREDINLVSESFIIRYNIGRI